MRRRHFLAAAAGVTIAACASNKPPLAPPAPDASEHDATIAALRPPKRARPVVAVLGSPHGSETTDLIIPYSVLREADVADAFIVSPDLAPLPLMPALTVRPQFSTAQFDAAHPGGADYVIVPAMHRADDPEIIAWIRAQHERGALLAGICVGALTLSHAGLIQGRRATTHWYRLDELRRANPHMQWARDRRYVVDDRVATTTGISASIPFSLALVEAIAGEQKAHATAQSLGVRSWNAAHTSAAFRLTPGMIATAAVNQAQFWNHEHIAIPIGAGIDEMALALVADVWSETYRSRAFAVGEGEVVTKRGLAVSPTANAGFDHRLAEIGNVAPAAALDQALREIGARYGHATAAFAALNLEYSWPAEG